MNKSESIKELAGALAKAQAELPAATFDAENPFLKNRYASLGAIIETSRPVLAKHGLAVSQLTITEGDQVGVTTVLMHASGEWLESTATLATGEERGKSSAQVAGSVITYLRRYSLASVLGMYADEDTDGHAPKPAAPVVKPAAKSNGGQVSDEVYGVDREETKKELVYTSPLAKIFKHTYPSEWVKKLMANPQYLADQPHIDNLLQQFAFPQETSADAVYAKVSEHIAQKTA